MDEYLQWGWRTQFADLGAAFQATPGLHFTAQAMAGRTRMGFVPDGRIWVDSRFRSAFLLATRPIGSGSVSARIEAFGTRGHGSEVAREDSEDGWAATIAARRPIGGHVVVQAEMLHIDSERVARTRDALDPHRPQTVFQMALRLRI